MYYKSKTRKSKNISSVLFLLKVFTIKNKAIISTTNKIIHISTAIPGLTIVKAKSFGMFSILQYATPIL